MLIPITDHMSSGLKIRQGPICPLTGSEDIEVWEEFPTSLLIECYQRDLGIDVAPEFEGVERLQLCRCLSSDLIFFYPSVIGSLEFYEQLQRFNWYYPEAKFEYESAAAWIKPGHRVLDIGCGAARFATQIPTASYTGLDPHFGSRNHGEHSDIEILSEEITTHSLISPNTYDVVCAFQVLEHFANPGDFLTAALTCLKSGGLLILGVPSADSYVTHIANFVLNAPPHHVTWWTDKALRHLADHFRLSILELSHAPVEPWETRLYWMQRMTGTFLPWATSHFTRSTSRKLVNVAAYVAARFMMSIAKPNPIARGASVVLVAQKVHGCS